MAKLFILICDYQDGRYGQVFTMDASLIDDMQKAYHAGLVSYGDIPGILGEGFQYSVINIPYNSTYESLGISTQKIINREDYLSFFENL